MGSTLGKVRKYTVSPADESVTSYKYNPVQTEGVSPPFTPPPLPEDLPPRPHRPTPRERARKWDPQAKESKESVDVFTTGYPPRILPEFYGFHVEDDMLIPPKYAHHYVKTGNQAREYQYPPEMKRPPPPPPPPPPLHQQPLESVPISSYSEPPPLPPRNATSRASLTSLSSDADFNRNPKPSQKVYSANDINRLLQPLKARLPPNIQPFEASVNVSATSQMDNFNSDRNSQCTCGHFREINEHYTRNRSPSSKPYVYSINNQQIDAQEIRKPPYKYFYPPPDYDTAMRQIQQRQQQQEQCYSTLKHEQVRPSSPQIRYNTIAMDRNIPKHQIPSHIGEPRYTYPTAGFRHPHFTTRQYNHHQNYPDTLYRPSTTNHEEKYQQQSRPEQDTLYRTGVLSQAELEGEVPFYHANTMPAQHYCGTIPEEGIWPPPPPLQCQPPFHTMNTRGYHP